MIQIGTVKSEIAARLVGDALYLEGIEVRPEVNPRGEWDLWVVDMDQGGQARKVLAEFVENPQSPRFVSASYRADEKRKAERKTESRSAEARPVTAIVRPWPLNMPPVTAACMFVSIVVTLICSFDFGFGLFKKLIMSQYAFVGPQHMLPEVRAGELWRLITPIFLHASIQDLKGLGMLHILFNMMWLKDLGTAIEARRGSRKLLCQILIIGIVSNLGQYLFWPPSIFFGMSGVVYGLLGYVWMQGRRYPFSGLFVPPQVMMFMMLWLVFGLTGAMNVANGCHIVGLGVGLLLGLVPSVEDRR